MAGFRGGYGGFGGGNQMQNLMKQAQKMQAEMQQNLEKAEEELENSTLTGTAGGGMVEVTCTGKKKITNISIKPEIVDPDDIEMLEDLIMAAANEALRKIDEASQASMSSITGGLGGMF